MACNLCGGLKYHVVWDKEEREKQGVLRSVVIRKDGYIVQGRNVMCDCCGLVYVWPRMNQEELNDFYANEYRKVYQNMGGAIGHAANAYRFIKDLGKHLDIGCSTGELIKRTGGMGIEPNKEHYEIAKAAGLNVVNVSIEEFKGETFDIVTLLNTLEHVLDPSSVLASVRELLNENGHLLVTVPNLLSTCLNRPIDAFLSNAHLYNFTPDTIIKMLAKAGLATKEVYIIPETMGEKIYVLAQKAEPRELPHHPVNVNALRTFLLYADRTYDIKYYLIGG